MSFDENEGEKKIMDFLDNLIILKRKKFVYTVQILI